MHDPIYLNVLLYIFAMKPEHCFSINIHIKSLRPWKATLNCFQSKQEIYFYEDQEI